MGQNHKMYMDKNHNMCMLQESQDVYVTRIIRCILDKNHKMYMWQES